jgi:hypothetical protein
MPKGPRKFHFSFERSGLTRFGGLTLFQSFANRWACGTFCSSTCAGPTIITGVIFTTDGSNAVSY